MSNISLAYDQIVTVVQAKFPTHKELANPYVPEQNDDLSYEKAWGVSVEGGINTRRQLGCAFTISRDLIITLTRKVYLGDLQRSNTASEKRRTKEKDLLEDQYQLIKEVETNVALGASTPITRIEYESDSGIEFIRSGQSDLIMIRSLFSMEYFENI